MIPGTIDGFRSDKHVVFGSGPELAIADVSELHKYKAGILGHI